MQKFCEICPDRRSAECELPTLSDKLAIAGHIALRAAAGLGPYAGHIAYTHENVVLQMRAARQERIATCVDTHISNEVAVFAQSLED